MKSNLSVFIFLVIVATVASLVVVQSSRNTKDSVVKHLKKEMESSALLGAKSISLIDDDGFIDLLILEQQKRGIETVIAEKLLFPPEGSEFIADYSVIKASSPDLIKSLSNLKKQDIANSHLEIGDAIGVVKLINTPRRILIIQLMQRDKFEQNVGGFSSTTNISLSAIYLLALLGFVLFLVSKKQSSLIKDSKAKKRSFVGATPRDKLQYEVSQSNNPALMLLDIEGFSKINEFYTHKVGDFFLDEFYKIVSFHLGKNAILYRIGGDEFAVLLKNSSQQEAEKVANELATRIPKESVFYEDFEISVDLFIGVAFAASNLLEKADTALKTAKRVRSSRVVVYSPALDPREQLRRDLEWAKKIHSAIVNEKVSSHFQQIVDSKTDEIFAYEALVRLIDDSGKEILPFEFLKSAKLSKQYSRLSRAMLRKSVASFSLRKDVLSFNITMDDINDKETLSFAKELIRRYDLGSRVIFEIALDEKIEDYSVIRNFIDELKSVGCRFAIDNFGSGAINLDIAVSLGVDLIKIDSSIIEKIDSDQNSYLLAKGIVAFAKEQNIKTVAKFVSSDQIRSKSIEIGVDYLQGYNIAKPTNKI